MTVKIYCDICGKEIPEEAKKEGWDTGKLSMGWGIWGEKATEIIFDFDALCLDCTKDVKEAVKECIKIIKVAAKVKIIG